MTRGSTLNIQFKVDAHASCIRVMSIDRTRICVASAKLACDIDATGVDYPTAFTVSSSLLKTCLKTLKFYLLPLSRHCFAQRHLGIKACAHCVQSFQFDYDQFELPMLDICNKPISAFDLSYELTFEMELNIIRNITKNAILHKGDEIQFTVHTNRLYMELAIYHRHCLLQNQEQKTGFASSRNL